MTSEKDIKKQNFRLIRFFDLLGIEIRIIGNLNNPAIIFENKLVLSCYVHNFDLRFTDKPKNGDLLFEHKLLQDQTFTDQQVDLMFDWLNNKEHRPCYSIGVRGTKLRLSRYNFLGKKEI